MRNRLLATLTATLACALGLPLAHADIYTWVDAKGNVNISNLEPPPDARVTNVTKERPMPPAPRNDAALEAERQAELQMLADRVRQLEVEAAAARRIAAAPPPAPVYIPIPVPTPVAYAPEPAPQPYGGCDPSWAGCWNAAWGYPYYPASVVVFGAPTHRRHPPHDRGHVAPRLAPGYGTVLLDPGPVLAMNNYNPGFGVAAQYPVPGLTPQYPRPGRGR